MLARARYKKFCPKRKGYYEKHADEFRARAKIYYELNRPIRNTQNKIRYHKKEIARLEGARNALSVDTPDPRARVQVDIADLIKKTDRKLAEHRRKLSIFELYLAGTITEEEKAQMRSAMEKLDFLQKKQKMLEKRKTFAAADVAPESPPIPSVELVSSGELPEQEVGGPPTEGSDVPGGISLPAKGVRRLLVGPGRQGPSHSDHEQGQAANSSPRQEEERIEEQIQRENRDPIRQ